MFCVKGNQAFCCLILICSVIFVVGDDAEHTYIKTDYCDYKCNEAPYMTTICLRKRKCGPVNDTCEEIGGTVEFRKEALDALNGIRNQIASGALQFRNAYAPGAYRMNALSYDLELEYIAQCYINLCRNVMEKCVASKRFPYAKGILVSTKKGSNISAILEHILTYNVVNLYLWDHRVSFNTSIDYTYHNCDLNTMILTIMCFDYIKYVGCGSSKYRGTTDHLYYCIFGLTENPEGKQVFDPCNWQDRATKCKTINQKYEYLCGNIEPIPIEPSWTNRQEKGQTNVYLEFGINPASTAQSTHFIYYTVRLIVICLGLLLHVIIIS